MKKFLLSVFVLFTLTCYGNTDFSFNEAIVIATSSDTEHYPILLELIFSISKYQKNNLKEISIFDIGLKESERIALNKIDKVKVYDLEMTNSDIFTKFKTRNGGNGKLVRGLYSWKPVAIKQALEKFQYVFYMDAAITIKKPLDVIFEYIKANGYLLVDCGHEIQAMCTDRAKKVFSLNNLKNPGDFVLKRGCLGGVQALSQSVLYPYVMPIYELAFDISNFEDDGTAPKGFGFGRHDQLLFSIKANLLGMKIAKFDEILSIRINNQEANFKLNDYIQFKPAWWIILMDELGK